MEEDLLETAPASTFITIERTLYSKGYKEIVIKSKPKRKQTCKENSDCSSNCSCKSEKIECSHKGSSPCSCGCKILFDSKTKCINQKFQVHTTKFKDRVEAKSSNSCIGLYATEDFGNGSFLFEIVGICLHKQEYKEREWQPYHTFFSRTEPVVCDATVFGNIGRFVRRSCTPNAKLKEVFVGDELRFAVYSTSGIAKGEEITISLPGDEKQCHFSCPCAAHRNSGEPCQHAESQSEVAYPVSLISNLIQLLKTDVDIPKPKVDARKSAVIDLSKGKNAKRDKIQENVEFVPFDDSYEYDLMDVDVSAPNNNKNMNHNNNRIINNNNNKYANQWNKNPDEEYIDVDEFIASNVSANNTTFPPQLILVPPNFNPVTTTFLPKSLSLQEKIEQVRINLQSTQEELQLASNQPTAVQAYLLEKHARLHQELSRLLELANQTPMQPVAVINSPAQMFVEPTQRPVATFPAELQQALVKLESLQPRLSDLINIKSCQTLALELKKQEAVAISFEWAEPLKGKDLTSKIAKVTTLVALRLVSIPANFKSNDIMRLTSLKNLLLLELDNCSRNTLSDKHLSSFTSFPSLVDISLSKCPGVSNEGINTLSNILPNLTALNIGGTSITNSIGDILSSFLHLRSLGLSDTPITNLTLSELPHKCPSITSLDISNCSSVTSQGIISFIQRISSLECLFLRQCYSVLPDFIPSLQRHPQFKKLDVSGCSQIRGESVQALVWCVPSLVSLKIANCNSLTPEQLYMLTSLKNLKELDISDCNLLREREVDQFESLMPQTAVARFGILGEFD